MSESFRRLAGLALLAVALALPAAQQDLKRAEQNRQAVTERLERVQRQVVQDALNKDRMARELRDVERLVASARGSWRDLRDRRAERATARQKLIEQRAAKEAERQRDQVELASQLRAAYFMGRNEPLKLALNQRNTAEISRNLTYYGYFGRMRAAQIEQLKQDVISIEEISAKIDVEDAELARLEGQQKERVGELDSALQQRGVLLASLEKESRGRTAEMAALQKQRQGLDRLVKQLSRAAESAPFDPNAPFARQRKQLAWPVAGRIAVDFGETTVGSLRSDGIDIDAERGADVHAVHEGRVAFADWWPGPGLTIVVDHGNGYLSLYFHNEQLFRSVGAWVQAGETIATVGDSGGRPTPGLRFEIRRAGKPVDPHAWFRTREPPAR